MRYDIRFRPEAEREFIEAIEWYSEQKAGLGRKFAKAVKSVLKFLKKMPRAHQVVVDDVRQVPIPGFPYVIIYQVEAKDVIIISVFHGKRDPSDWHDRL